MATESQTNGAGTNPGALAEQLEKLASGLGEHFGAPEGAEADQVVKDHLEGFRRVASALRDLALLHHPDQAEATAERQEELKAIAASISESIRELARTNDRVRERMGHEVEELDAIAKLPPGEQVTTRLLRAVSRVRDATKELGEEADTAAASIGAADGRIATLVQQLEEAREQARLDGLTRLYNRATLDEELRNAVDRGTTAGPWCFLLGDIDHFKRVNDQFGHMAGDALLRMVAQIMQSTLRAQRVNGFIARYGGEEFGIVLPRTTLDRAVQTAEQVRSTLQAKKWQLKGKQGVLRATISIGVAQYRSGDTASALVQRADQALYRAKEEGRNRVVREA